MQVAIYGGSFNPPHIGHAMVAAWLRWTGRADEVWWVPAFDHAFDKPLAPFDLRMDACRCVADSLGPWAKVCGIERELEAPSYTIHTLDQLQRRHPQHRLRWIMGADALPTVHLWREWERIERDYAPIVVGRAGHPEVPGSPTFPAISSTLVRQLLREGAAIDHLVDARLLTLLRAHSAAFLSGAA